MSKAGRVPHLIHRAINMDTAQESSFANQFGVIADGYESTQTDPVAFFDTVYDAYLKAESADHARHECYYSIGGFSVRLRFATSTLISCLTSAFSHLTSIPCTDPDLTICVWDSVSTGVAMPSPPWYADDYRERGEIRGYNTPRIRTVFQVGPYALSLLDLERNLGIYWINAAEQLPYYEQGAPFRIILHWWMQSRGIQFTHAGAIGMPEGGVLLAGKGGSGKSNTALASLRSDLHYAGDDYCLLAPRPSPTVYSVYCTGKVNPADLCRFPFLHETICNQDRLETEKALLFLHDAFSSNLVMSFPLRAILIPRVTGKVQTTIQSVSSATGLKAMAPSTLFQLPSAGRSAFQMLTSILKQVPCYTLHLGTDVTHIPSVIGEFLHTLNHARQPPTDQRRDSDV